LASSGQTATAKEADLATESGRILIVDDNRMNRLKLTHDVEQQGHTVATAEDGHRAIEMMLEQPFDVVLLDIVMPEMDGYQVLERMKETATLREIPVIVISAVDEMDSVVRCIEMGAEDYLPKPFNSMLLAARLGACLQKKKLRDLERAYLQQEVALRQSEKLATLGRLSAGMAHELNNPASAAQRGAAQLQETMFDLQQAQLALAGEGLTAEQCREMASLVEEARARSQTPTRMDALDQSDAEAQLEAWLQARGVDEPWTITAGLIELGYQPAELVALGQQFSDQKLGVLLTWLSRTVASYGLLGEIEQGAGRIVEIVQALKTYSYMDQAPVQVVDVRHGLESTIVMLRSKLRGGISVEREYAEDLPSIQAFGSELNQVWTNIIDNAIQAMEGRGRVILRTRRNGGWVEIDIEDDGPGIPDAVQAKVFDPFFTTKPPGQGTGLGLNVSYGIVEKHHGHLTVTSRPGCTCFTTALPIEQEPAR
jgi:signal transduction histidine kinase